MSQVVPFAHGHESRLVEIDMAQRSGFGEAGVADVVLRSLVHLPGRVGGLQRRIGELFGFRGLGGERASRIVLGELPDEL